MQQPAAVESTYEASDPKSGASLRTPIAVVVREPKEISERIVVALSFSRSGIRLSFEGRHGPAPRHERERSKVKYMFLLFDSEAGDGTEGSMEPWIKFGEDASKMAAMHGGEALQPSSTATVVSVRGGKRVVTDGPFITTKEQLGGFYIFDCENLDIAMKLAEMIPNAPTGYIEIRPILDMGQ
jgi:hypothetical protein